MEVKIKKLSNNAITPTRATIGAVAFDLYLPNDVIVLKGRQIIPLDIAIELPEGYEAKIEARSGFSSKGILGVFISDSDMVADFNNNNLFYDADVLVGKIDYDYRGNIGVIVKSNNCFLIKAGTRIAQMTIYKVEYVNFTEVDVLSETERGDGGFGSTNV